MTHPTEHNSFQGSPALAGCDTPGPVVRSRSRSGVYFEALELTLWFAIPLSLTRPPTHSPSCPVTHSITHSLTPSLTKALLSETHLDSLIGPRALGSFIIRSCWQPHFCTLRLGAPSDCSLFSRDTYPGDSAIPTLRSTLYSQRFW